MLKISTRSHSLRQYIYLGTKSLMVCYFSLPSFLSMHPELSSVLKQFNLLLALEWFPTLATHCNYLGLF